MTIDRMTGPLTVGQLAARAGVRADTIRYYERSGLLPEPNRTDGDHRRYGAADLDRMLFIRGAQRLGLRLAEIRELLVVRETGRCPCGPAETLLAGAHRRAQPGDRPAHRAPGRALRDGGRPVRAVGALPGPCSGHLVRGRSSRRPNRTRGEVTGMCSCCDDLTCDGSCCESGLLLSHRSSRAARSAPRRQGGPQRSAGRFPSRPGHRPAFPGHDTLVDRANPRHSDRRQRRRPGDRRPSPRVDRRRPRRRRRPRLRSPVSRLVRARIRPPGLLAG